MGILLFQEKQLSIQEAVDIINFWRAHPSKYYLFLQNKNASVTLWGYDHYSREEDEHIFEPTDIMILAPKLAYKFFELEKEDLTDAFLETLDALTFVNKDDDDDEVDDNDDEDNDTQEKEYDYFHWPYFEAECVACLSANNIEKILKNWHYVFNCNFDTYGGMIYNLMYAKLNEAEKCCDCLAVNSFNMNSWLTREEHPIGIRARHYIMSNYSVAYDDDDQDTYFRKLVVHYLQGIWDNLDSVVRDIYIDQSKRNN